MKKIKLILVGYGNMGKEWAKVIPKIKHIQLIGVIDLLPKNRQQALKEFQFKEDQVSDQLEMLLQQYKPDAILDCSPPFAHLGNTTIALNYGCHVLGEKPISLIYKDAEKVIQLSKKKNKIYMINQNYRRNPLIKIIRDKLRVIGKVYSINIDYYQSLEFNDTYRYKMNHPLLTDMSIHHFDLVRNIINKNAKTVYAEEFISPSSKFKNGTDTLVTFKMDNAVNFNYRGSWSAVGFNTSYNGEWRIVGEYGSILWDGNLNLKLETKLKNGKIILTKINIPKKYKFDPYTLFLYELEQNLRLFINSIINNLVPDCWCGDNIHSLSMILSAIRSSEKGRRVKVYS